MSVNNEREKKWNVINKLQNYTCVHKLNSKINHNQYTIN